MNGRGILRAGVALLCAALALSTLGAAEAPATPEQILAGMTLEEKICQLFIVRPEALCEATYADGPKGRLGYSLTSVTRDTRAGLAAYPVGGVALFGQNLASPEQLTSLIGDLQGASRIPLFVAVDEEGGSVARLANSGKFGVPKVGSMGKLGATGDPANARAAYRTIGGYIAPYGINLDFAPVADVNTNPRNIVIGSRAFGSDPQAVAEMVVSALDGLHSVGVMGCVKHFPGHGDTSGDTHEGYVSVDKNWEELSSCELVPFIATLDETDMVMAAHITLPNVTDDGLPASLSAQMIQGKLRDELGYEGVVITDSLAMGAIANQYGPGEAAVKALQAGADILLMPAALPEAVEGIQSALQDGTLTQDRLNESVLRILTLKAHYNLL